MNYDVNKLNLDIGDKLFLYTDGITEATNEDNQQFGIERLVNIIKKEGNILNSLKSSLDEYCKLHKDDYAILVSEII